MARRSRKRNLIVVGVLAIGLVAAGYALTAANTMPAATRAGDGAVAISGYTVNNVTYNLDALDPSKISSYEFDLSANAKQAKAKLLSASTTYDTCTESLTVDNHWTCTPAVAVDVLAADNLRVIATE